jgi:hypothetical protein
MYSLFCKTESKRVWNVEGIISAQRNLQTGLRFQQNSKGGKTYTESQALK